MFTELATYFAELLFFALLRVFSIKKRLTFREILHPLVVPGFWRIIRIQIDRKKGTIGTQRPLTTPSTFHRLPTPSPKMAYMCLAMDAGKVYVREPPHKTGSLGCATGVAS